MLPEDKGAADEVDKSEKASRGNMKADQTRDVLGGRIECQTTGMGEKQQTLDPAQEEALEKDV